MVNTYGPATEMTDSLVNYFSNLSTHPKLMVSEVRLLVSIYAKPYRRLREIKIRMGKDRATEYLYFIQRRDRIVLLFNMVSGASNYMNAS